MKIKYLLDFENEPTLLICSDQNGLRALSNSFLKIAERSMLDSIIANSSSILVTARRVGMDQGLKLIAEKNGRREFSWSITASKWTEFHERVRILADSDKAAHQYLEVNEDDAVIIVSSEDYDRIFASSDEVSPGN